MFVVVRHEAEPTVVMHDAGVQYRLFQMCDRPSFSYTDWILCSVLPRCATTELDYEH